MKIYVVGIGAGSADGMTFEARNVLEKADVIVGYTVYAELVKKLFPEKEYFVSAMKQEAERCRKAVEMAADGRNVAVVCSGDAGVYGTASLVYEIAAGYENVEVSVVAGVSAMLSGGALVGAPLGHDFAVISLSELKNYSADMFTTVFIGNSMTKNIGGKMVTPRGYKNV